MEPKTLEPPVVPQRKVNFQKKRIIYSTEQQEGITVCKDAVRPTEHYLRGEDVYVDYECGYAHLPAWDLEGNRAVGVYDPPLVVFLETTEHLIGIPEYNEFKQGRGGVYTCPTELKPLYKGYGHWISKRSELKKIRRTNNHVRAVAEIVVHRVGLKNRLRCMVLKILKFLKLVTAVTAASTI